jgi:hypothetical protein
MHIVPVAHKVKFKKIPCITQNIDQIEVYLLVVFEGFQKRF